MCGDRVAGEEWELALDEVTDFGETPQQIYERLSGPYEHSVRAVEDAVPRELTSEFDPSQSIAVKFTWQPLLESPDYPRRAVMVDRRPHEPDASDCQQMVRLPYQGHWRSDELGVSFETKGYIQLYMPDADYALFRHDAAVPVAFDAESHLRDLLVSAGLDPAGVVAWMNTHLGNAPASSDETLSHHHTVQLDDHGVPEGYDGPPRLLLLADERPPTVAQ